LLTVYPDDREARRENLALRIPDRLVLTGALIAEKERTKRGIVEYRARGGCHYIKMHKKVVEVRAATLPVLEGLRAELEADLAKIQAISDGENKPNGLVEIRVKLDLILQAILKKTKNFETAQVCAAALTIPQDGDKDAYVDAGGESNSYSGVFETADDNGVVFNMAIEAQGGTDGFLAGLRERQVALQQVREEDLEILADRTAQELALAQLTKQQGDARQEWVIFLTAYEKDRDVAAVIRAKDLVIRQKEGDISAKDRVISNKDKVIQKKDRDIFWEKTTSRTTSFFAGVAATVGAAALAIVAIGATLKEIGALIEKNKRKEEENKRERDSKYEGRRTRRDFFYEQ
jgi:hypothetical protein